MAICTNCGADKGFGAYCGRCGDMSSPQQPNQSQPSQNWQGSYPPPGQPQQNPYPYPNAPQPQFYGAPSKDKLTTALLALFIGGLGIHKFYLGGSKQKTAGIIQIVLTFVTCGVAGIIPFIEGIIYLMKSDQEFQYLYVQNGKDWF